jgi:hypothetical protein
MHWNYQALMAARAGEHTAACDAWERARTLHHAYATPLLAPAAFSGPHEPARALRGLLRLPGALVAGFEAQQTSATNFLILVLFPLLIAGLLCSLLIFGRHAPHLHHLLWEYLQPVLPRTVAKFAVWGLLALPLVWNLGALLWAAVLLAACFPLLTHAERRFGYLIVGLLVMAPWGIELTARIIAPSDPAHPAAAIWRAQHSGSSALTRAELEGIEEHHGPDGALYFTKSLIARQAGDVRAARTALERAESQGDLPGGLLAATKGILAYQEGNVEEAIRRLVKATEAEPDRFSARYNLSKAYARASLFLKADREMRHAFRLNAGRARYEEQRRLEARVDDLIQERLSTFDLWRYLAQMPAGAGMQIPKLLTYLFPGGNPRLLWVVLLVIPVAALTTARWHRRLHIHTCCQCGRTVCRRCLKRQDRRVFCSHCALTAGRWASAQYTQILLTKLLGRHDRVRDRLLDIGRFLVPGLGAVLRGNTVLAFIQPLIAAGAILWLSTGGLPIRPLPWTALEERLLPATAIGIGVLALLQMSIIAAELRGMRKRMSLKQFLGAARPRGTRVRAA